MSTTNYKKYAFAAMLTIMAFVIGVLIGYFSRRIHVTSSSSDDSEILSKLSRRADPDITQRIIDEINVNKFDEVLRHLTAVPRLAGTENQQQSAEFVHRLFKESGLTSEIISYDVLLSYPVAGHNNTVSVVDSDDNVVYESSPFAEIDEEYEQVEHLDVPAFHAFSPSGEISADLVYANYAREKDFEHLQKNGISCKDKIVIARYGKIFRGNKVEFAARAGAVGIVVFSDPADGGPPYDNGTESFSGAYPDSIWLPDTGIQWGNVVLHKGDQTTPGYPSLWYSKRLTDKDVDEKMPKIPSQPIGYKDAFAILSNMEGPEVPEEWRGALKLTYRYGPKLKMNRTVKISVKNENRIVPIYNVIGKIQGEIEPDRYVLIGNHRDAWQYGSVDPASGSMIIQEAARVFGKLAKEGWRPRRSILFCSWDAEEYGLVGSYEYVEDNMAWLRTSAVAYINSDSGVTGNATLYVKSVPLMKQAFIEASKVVNDPRDDSISVFDSWRNGRDVPRTYPVGSGSDHSPFVANAGVPAVYPKYKGTEESGISYKGTSSPLYHTRFQTYRAYRMIDPEYKFARAVAAIMYEICRNYADSLVLPLDVSHYVEELKGHWRKLQQVLPKTDIDSKYYDGVERALGNVSNAAKTLEEQIQNLDRKNPLAVRAINDKLMAFERAFLDINGIPRRPRYKHIIHSPSAMNHYGGSGFPGAEELLYYYHRDKSGHSDKSSGQDDPEKTVLWELEQHLSVIAYSIFSAAKTLSH